MKSLANQYVNSLKQQCESKASTKPGGGDDGVKDKLCPNDCSQHGTCIGGRLTKDLILHPIHIPCIQKQRNTSESKDAFAKTK